MVLDYDQKGLPAPSIDALAKSLKLAWISRLLAGEQKQSESWKAIPNYMFGKYRIYSNKRRPRLSTALE